MRYLRGRKAAEAFERDWGDLSRYNAEVARGIVHTPEMDERMAAKLTAYRAWQREEWKREGYSIEELDDGTIYLTKG